MKNEMRDGIIQRGKNSFAFIVELGRGANGKRIQKWVTVRGTRKDAKRERDKMRVQKEEGSYVVPTNETLGEFLTAWLVHVKATVSGKTFEEYERIVNRYLIPRLGHVALKKLNATQIQSYYLWLQGKTDDVRTEGKGALAPRTIQHHHVLLKSALDRAVKWNRIPRTPMKDDAVIAPKAQDSEARALTKEQTAKVIELSRPKRYYIAVLVALFTGMRRGEICALKWKNVDLDKGSLLVVETLEEVKTRVDGMPQSVLTFKPPKTKRGRRKIALPSIAVEELRRYKAQQAKEKLMMGPGYQDDGLVFCNVDGTPYRPNLLTVNYASLIRRAPAKYGLQGTNFHSLRHTHATRLLEQGVHIKVVSERLGHATVSITLDVYSHVSEGIQEDAAEKMDAGLRAAMAAS